MQGRVRFEIRCDLVYNGAVEQSFDRRCEEMKYAWIAFAVVLIPGFCLATPYVAPEEAPQVKPPEELSHIVLPPQGPSTLSYDPLTRYEMACDFIVTMQVSDTSLVTYGGMREGEHLLNIIQTDNTSESIWMWSHYYDLTGSDDYHENVDAAWEYCMHFPAYNEEGDDDPVSGYYRRYNCSWALRAEMEYRRVYGDNTHSAYAESCASYLCHHPMVLSYPVGTPRRLNPMIMGWVVGNLYEYGQDVGNAVYVSKALDMADSLKVKVENNPNRLHHKEWAMGGGSMMWGLVNSHFAEYPAGKDTWIQTYAPYMDTEVDSSQYQNAWRGWSALGQWTAASELGSSLYYGYFKHLADTLVANDGDLDGGIPVTDPETDDRDQSWVTNYLGYMCLDRMLIDAGVTPVALVSGGLRVAVLESPSADVPAFRLDLAEASDVVFSMFDVEGRRIVSRDLGRLDGGSHTLRWDRPAGSAGIAPGVYFFRFDGTRSSATGKVVVIK
jgi:hypothetical protein